MAESSVTDTLLQARTDPSAVERLTEAVYERLHQMASHYIRGEAPGRTLQATALVHEAYLQLIEDERVDSNHRAHFLAVAAQTFRRILIQNARQRHALKRGGDRERVTLSDSMGLSATEQIETADLAEALERLSQRNPRWCQVVEMRFFAGLDDAEIAALLDIAERTVRQDWLVARAWLRRELT